MNIDALKKECQDTDAQGFSYLASIAPRTILALIAQLEGSRFAADSHLRTVKTQERIIASYQAREALMRTAIVDLFQRMEKSYSAEPTRRITFMDLDAVFSHVAALGFGGCLDGAAAPTPPASPSPDQ